MARGFTRRELRDDKLVNAARHAVNWIQDHTYLALGLVAGTVVVILAISGLAGRQRGKSAVMEASFARSAIDFGMGDFATAALAYENFLARFPGSRWAADAALRAANAHFFLGHVDDARDLYQRYLADYAGDPFMDRAARHGLAACYEQTDDLAAAAAIYEELVEIAPSPVERAYQLRSASRCREGLGDWDAAYDLLQRAEEAVYDPDYPPNPVAAQHLRELAAKQHIRSWQQANSPSG